MPLVAGHSKAAIAANIATEIRAGKDPKQAAAIAYDQARRSKDHAAKPEAPPFCNVLNWTVFANGFHKGELYSPEKVRQIAANFERLKGYLNPVAGLGHDKEQRLAQSLGLPNAGHVTGVRTTDGTDLILDVRRVPTWLGAQINAGRYPSGSVELKDAIPDPKNPAELIPGPVLDGVAFLGEEQPAVKGLPPPVATFDDGTPVPPSAAPVEVKVQTAGGQDGRAAFSTLCFSDAEQPVDPVAAATEALKKLTPDQLKQVLAQCQGMADATAQAPGGAAVGTGPQAVPPPAPPPGQMSDGVPGPQADNPGTAVSPDTLTDNMSAAPAWFSAFAAKIEKRMADAEAAINAAKKDKDKAEESAYAAMSAAVVDDAIRQHKILPRDRARFVNEGIAVLKTRTFSDTAHPTPDAAFAAWKADVDSRPRSVFGHDALATTGATGKPTQRPPLSANGLAVMAGLRHTAPRVYERLTKTTKTN